MGMLVVPPCKQFYLRTLKNKTKLGGIFFLVPTTAIMSVRNKSKKELEDEKKRAEEERAAQAYEEFVATFEDVPTQKGKVWVKAGTFDAGSRKEDNKDKGKLYKPTSKLAELAEKFSSAERAAQYNNKHDPPSDRPDKPGKKKLENKKKSNL